MAYDGALQIVDYVNGECTQEIVMRKDICSQAEVNRLAISYGKLINSFIKNLTSPLNRLTIFKDEEVANVMKFS